MTTVTCHRCGAVLPSESTAPCPRCLLQPAWDRPGYPAITLGPGQSFDPPSVDELNQHLVGYEVTELIGRGGMGAVYRGRQLSLDRPVAIKILPPEIAQRPGFRERFGREARALAKLNHPNIVAVHDYGQAGPFAMLVMELVDGASLRDVLAQGKLSAQEALEIVPQLCDALSYAHEKGVVHRDIKPENLLFEQQGQLKITDFGLAKIISRPSVHAPADHDSQTETTLDEAELTQSIVGTIHYMAPEQIERPSEVDHRADIYALGVVLYEMLTGELPLGRFDPPSQRVQLDIRFDEVVLKALSKQPQRRYASAASMRHDVDSIHSNPKSSASTRVHDADRAVMGRTVGDWLHETTDTVRRAMHRGATFTSQRGSAILAATNHIRGSSPSRYFGILAFGVLVAALLSTWFIFVAIDDDFAVLVWLPITMLATLAFARHCHRELSKVETPPVRSPLLDLTLRLLYFPIIAIGLLWPIALTLVGWSEFYGPPRDPWQSGIDGLGWGRDAILIGSCIVLAMSCWFLVLLTIHAIWPLLLAFLFSPLIRRSRTWWMLVVAGACFVAAISSIVMMSRFAYEEPALGLLSDATFVDSLDISGDVASGTARPGFPQFSAMSPRDVARVKQWHNRRDKARQELRVQEQR